MEIYIPTRNRVFQETFSSLPEAFQKMVVFVVPFDTYDVIGGRILMTPPGIQGIGPTRQWIIDNATSNKIVMLDDDLVFATRRKDAPTKFIPSTPEDIALLFTDIGNRLNNYAHVGVATREGGNRDISNGVVNTRLLRILAYRVDMLRAESIRFDRLEFMEDFDVTLQLLRAGYENFKINWIVHNQRSSNAPGGCSTYRTLEGQSKAARELKRYHPEFVSVVTKTTKTAWNGATRDDVTIQWKKAIASAKSIRNLSDEVPLCESGN
jgi:hypothetical protein